MLHKGVQMTLMMGPVIPFAAPRVVMDALDSVEVTTAAGSTSGFQLTLQIDPKSDLNGIFLIAAAQSATPVTPALRVMIVVTLDGTPQPLFDGVMTNVEVHTSSKGHPGTITVTGEDVTKVMDMMDWSGLPFPALPIEARVALLCAKYAPFGVIPLVVPVLFPDIPIPIERIPASRAPTCSTSRCSPSRSATSSTSSRDRWRGRTSRTSGLRSR